MTKRKRTKGQTTIYKTYIDFTPKNHIFFIIVEGGAKILGVFRVKNHDFTPKNLIFSNFRGEGHAPGTKKDKRTNNDLQNIHIKLKMEYHEPH
jgi:hypothetical protein